jgi:hypothetical protein
MIKITKFKGKIEKFVSFGVEDKILTDIEEFKDWVTTSDDLQSSAVTTLSVECYGRLSF